MNKEQAVNYVPIHQVSSAGGWGGVFDAPARVALRRGVEDSAPATQVCSDFRRLFLAYS